VRLGDRGSRYYFALLHVGATCSLGLATLVVGSPWLLLPTAIAGGGGWMLCRGLFHTTGRALNPYLGRSALLELVTAVILAAALML
jgi:1,4-dihydroxy-2-naphthoate octaprenyltransferase